MKKEAVYQVCPLSLWLFSYKKLKETIGDLAQAQNRTEKRLKELA